MPANTNDPWIESAAPVVTSSQMASVHEPTPVRPSSPPTIRAVASERYKVQFTIGPETHRKLRRVQDLLRHAVPTGDVAEIFDRAVTLLLREVERRKLAHANRRRAADGASSNRRHVPASVKRAVWARDQGRCAFIGTRGRCGERGFLEFHHVLPFAAGGLTTVENLQLRCRAHNDYENRIEISRSLLG